MIKKVTTGILGAGQNNIATSQHLPASLKSEIVELKALCDRLESVHEYAEKAGVKAYTDYAQMLADPEIDMIQIATPDQFHCEHALMALDAGKHVLLQKPPCITLEEIQKLRDAASKSSGKLKIILNQRYSRLTRSIRKHIEDGVVGEVREIIIRFRGRRFPIDNLNSFYLTKESGGVWIHNTMHWLDEAFFYSDIMPTTINVYSTKNENGIPQCLGEGSNYWSAVFPMGPVTFLFEYNTMLIKDNMPNGMQRIIIGTKGEMRQNYGSSEIFLYEKGSEEVRSLPILNPEFSNMEDSVDSFCRGIDDFANEILDGDERCPKVKDSLKLFELLFEGLK